MTNFDLRPRACGEASPHAASPAHLRGGAEPMILEGAVNMVAELPYENGPRLVIELIPWSDGGAVHADKALRFVTRANAATRARMERTLAEGPSCAVGRASKRATAKGRPASKLPVRRTKGSPTCSPRSPSARPFVVRDQVLRRLELDRKLRSFDGRCAVGQAPEVQRGGRPRPRPRRGVTPTQKPFAWIERSRGKIEKAVVAKLFRRTTRRVERRAAPDHEREVSRAIKVESVAACRRRLRAVVP